MSQSALYFLTGSCGSGKTTLLKGVVESVYPELAAYHFDDLMKMPSLEEMNARYGGPSQWQAFVTREWIKQLAQFAEADLVVVDSQARPSVIMDAAHDAGFTALHITLIDCSHAERRRRLLEDRKQPELDQLDSYAWAAYLRGQADAFKLEIINTTSQSKQAGIEQLAHSLGRFANETVTSTQRRNRLTLILKS